MPKHFTFSKSIIRALPVLTYMCNIGIISIYYRKGVLPCLFLKSDSPKNVRAFYCKHTRVLYVFQLSAWWEHVLLVCEIPPYLSDCRAAHSSPSSNGPPSLIYLQLADRRSTLQVTSSCLTIACKSCDHKENLLRWGDKQRDVKKKKALPFSLFPLVLSGGTGGM